MAVTRPWSHAAVTPGGSLPRHTQRSTEKSTEKSTSQVLPRSQKPTGMPSTDTHCEVYQVIQDSIEASFRERNHEVDQMVTKADFEQPVNATYR